MDTLPHDAEPDSATGRPGPETGVRRGNRRKVVLAGLLLLALLGVFHRPLLVGFAHQFRVDDPAPSDAIVLLIGDFGNDRPRKASELYHQGLAPTILMGSTPVTPAKEAVLEAGGGRPTPSWSFPRRSGARATRPSACVLTCGPIPGPAGSPS